MYKALFSLAVCSALTISLSADADVKRTPERYDVEWKFWTVDAKGEHDFSKNLSIPLGTTLPDKLVKRNWSCTRLALVEEEQSDTGRFVCAGPEDSKEISVSCSKLDNDKNAGWMSLVWDDEGKEIRIAFYIQCRSVPAK